MGEPASLVGTTFLNRYQIADEVGRGGMGVIYRVRDVLLDRDVALKLLTDPRLGAEGRDRLLREARAAARLNHPNIVSIYDAGQADLASGVGSTPFIVMELVEGESLYHRWPLPLAEILSVARQVCAALEHAHAHGIIHRDLKLENILLTGNGQVKLTDFGLARSLAARMTQEGALSGTVFYLAPELALGQPFDGRADLYALGVMLYELTTGKLPFDADDPLAVIAQHLYAPVVPPRTHQPDLPSALDALIVHLLAKAPDDRPASAAEVRRLLEIMENVGRLDAGQQAAGDDLSPLDRLVRGRLVGREREIGEMMAVWRQAATGEPDAANVLLVSGEPGIGKTRLVRELIARVEVSGGEAFIAECYAEGGAPYAPITQIIQAASQSVSGERLRALSPISLADLLTLAPALRARFPDVPSNPPLEPQAEQQRLFESAVELCALRAQRNPLLLVIDDAHWADSGTLFLLRHLARRARLRSRRLPLLVVLTYREIELDQARALNDVLAGLQRERLATRLKLSRLTREQTHDLLKVMFQEAIAPEFVDGIYRETEGNPFFIEEVCKALIEQGAFYRANGHWQRAQMDQVQIPQSVRVAVQARVNALSGPAQTALRLAAIIGREFDFETLRHAGDVDEETLVEALEVAERAQLIEEVRGPGGREAFSFAHALIPHALRESVSGLRRHRMHRRVASAIQQLRPDDFEALAYHYGQAGDEPEARLYYRKAGDRARAVYANEDAIRFYTEALTLMPEGEPDQFDLLAARAQMYDLVGRRDEQRADVEALRALAERWNDDQRRFEALLAETDFLLTSNPVQAQALAERTAELARSLGDPLREGLALRRLGWAARVRGDLLKSREVLKTAATRFREAGQLNEAAACLHTLSLTLSDLREQEAAEQAVEEALALSRQVGDRRHEAISLRRLAILLEESERLQEALTLAEQALALHRQLGDRSEECHALNVVGMLRAALGQFAEAEPLFRQSAALAESIELNVGLWNSISNLVDLRHRQRDHQAALAVVEEYAAHEALMRSDSIIALLNMNRAFALANLGQFTQALDLAQAHLPSVGLFGAAATSELYAFIARCQTELGDHAASRQSLETALAKSAETGLPFNRGLALYELTYLMFRQSEAVGGDRALLQAGRGYIQEALSLGRHAHFLAGLPYALNYAAEIELALGELDQALAYSSEALHIAEEVQPWRGFLVERFWYTHSRLLRALQRTAEANDYLCRARDLVLVVAGRLTEEGLRRAWLENVWANRGILADVARLALS